MTAFLKQLEERRARYRALRKMPDLSKEMIAELEGCLDELDWVARQLAMVEPATETDPQPKAKQLSLV